MNGSDDMDETTDATASWESEMGEEFERRVRDLRAAPLDLGSVKGTAMKIRNRRRATIAGGILAAAAVIVPVAVLATNGSTNGATRLDPADVPSVVVTERPATPAPTREPSPAPTPTPDAPPPDDLSLGFDYLEAGSGTTVLHESDGGTVELPHPDYSDAASLGSTIAAYRFDANAGESGEGAVDLIEEGEVRQSYDVRGRMAIAPDGRTVGFVTTDDELLVLNGAAGEQSLGTIDSDVSLAAFVGSGDCALESGCHPFLEYDDFVREPFEINYEGPDTNPVPGALRIFDAADGFLVTAQTESTDSGSCSVLRDRQVAQTIFETCEAVALDISPDGQHVTGSSPYGDGLGPSYFTILDRDGQEVARYDVPQGFVFLDLAWTDDDHAVASVFEDGQWKVVSLGVDGSVDVVVGPVDGVAEVNPFRITGGYPG